MNDLQSIMKKKINGIPKDGRPLIGHETSKAAANWLKKHKQTNNGKTYEKIKN